MSDDPSRSLGDHDFPVPVEDRYWEDYVPGSAYEYGYASLTEADIVAFAARYDPQPMHVDAAASAGNQFGGLIASGWHTGAVAMRLYVDHYISRVASLASPGMDEMRWPHPVRPGDVLRIRTTIDDARVSRSRPDRGLVFTTIETRNQHDVLVMSMKAMNFFGRRPA